MNTYTGRRCTRPKPLAWGRRCFPGRLDVETIPDPVDSHGDRGRCWCEPAVEELPDGSRLFVHRRAQ